MSQIEALFWDNGGVILTNGWDREARKRAVEKFHLDWEDFADRHELMLNAFETGQATLDQYLQRTVFYRPRDFTADAFKAFMFAQSQPFPDALEFLAEIAASRKYIMAALNNESKEINEYRIAQFELKKYFEAFFSSCYLGVRKPDIEIYHLVMEITQRRPSACVMIDDRELNLECARELGLQTIQVKNTAQLKADLARLGVSAGNK
ncbi:MAG TPA: HAD family phosphatase [Candidatus Acidoferrum sp.]|jgi:putative hydrolase of the HAD superfamily|nr:HAD family phosphatase [Candidatus Acidoferrum sp.]